MSRSSQTRQARASRSQPANDGPPRLQFHLGKRLGFFALANGIPLIIVIYVAIGLHNGSLQLAENISGGHLLLIAVIIAAAASILISSWFILPVARWVHAWPRWHFRRRSRWLWALPTLGGWLFCALAYLLATLGLLLCLAVIGYCAYDVFASIGQPTATPSPF